MCRRQWNAREVGTHPGEVPQLVRHCRGFEVTVDHSATKAGCGRLLPPAFRRSQRTAARKYFVPFTKCMPSKSSAAAQQRSLCTQPGIATQLPHIVFLSLTRWKAQSSTKAVIKNCDRRPASIVSSSDQASLQISCGQPPKPVGEHPAHSTWNQAVMYLSEPEHLLDCQLIATIYLAQCNRWSPVPDGDNNIQQRDVVRGTQNPPHE